MDLGDNRCALAHCRRDTLGRTGADIANGEDAGATGFERKRALPGNHESRAVGVRAALQPLCVRICADEQEEGLAYPGLLGRRPKRRVDTGIASVQLGVVSADSAD
jgi:hypothetical protein